MAIANSRQYGNGAIIAPLAQLDDGKLDLVVVNHRPAWQVLLHTRRLFSGAMAHVPGVSMTKARSISISADSPLLYHVDGEPFTGSRSITASVRRRALRVLSS